MDIENPAPFLRLFIALTVPEEVGQAIERAQGQLKRNSPPGAFRWTRAEQFHVTLKFLGDIALEQLEQLTQAVSGACAWHEPLRLEAYGIGFFPNRQRMKVVWVGAGDDRGRLTELHRSIEEAVKSFAPTDPPEKFSGHITLGRLKPGFRGSLERVTERADHLGKINFGKWMASDVEIMRSELKSEGAIHSTICRCELAGKRSGSSG